MAIQLREGRRLDDFRRALLEIEGDIGGFSGYDTGPDRQRLVGAYRSVIGAMERLAREYLVGLDPGHFYTDRYRLITEAPIKPVNVWVEADTDARAQLEWLRDLINELEQDSDGATDAVGPTTSVQEDEGLSTPRSNVDRRKVFVVHGRNEAARDGVFTFLRAIGLHPIEWEQAVQLTGSGSPYIGDVLDRAFAEAQAVVVLLTPDEIAYLRREYAEGDDDPEAKPNAQARPNVLYEAGMAMGRNAERTVLVELGKVRPFTDVIGRHFVRLDNSAPMRKALAQRLQTAGCEVDLSGDDWLKAGDVTPPPRPGDGPALGKRVPAPSSNRVQFDANYYSRGSSDGRLQIVNRGSETAYEVNVEFPPEASNAALINVDLPLTKLPPGKSASFPVARHLGPGKNHFDVHITARLDDGTPVEEDVFISLTR